MDVQCPRRYDFDCGVRLPANSIDLPLLAAEFPRLPVLSSEELILENPIEAVAALPLYAA